MHALYAMQCMYVMHVIQCLRACVYVCMYACNVCMHVCMHICHVLSVLHGCTYGGGECVCCAFSGMIAM